MRDIEENLIGVENLFVMNRGCKKERFEESEKNPEILQLKAL